MDILNLSDSSESQVLKITAIKAAVKNENRANIFVNNEFAFSLDIAQIVDFHLKVGQTISQEDFLKYQQASEFGKLYQATLEWVLTKPRSVRETRDYLRRKLNKRQAENKLRAENQKRSKEDRAKYHLKIKQLPLFSEQDIDQVIERLIEKKYLDDIRFAQTFTENRNATKGTSLKKLRQELIKKGISGELIEETIAASDRSDKSELAKIIEKKQHKYSDPEKLKAYLARQGFNYADITEVLGKTGL